MTMIGLEDSSYFIGIFLFYLVQVFISSIGSSIMIRIGVFPHINFFIVFIFLFLFYISLFPFAIIITAIFTSKTATMLVGILGFYISFEFLSSISNTYNSSKL